MPPVWSQRTPSLPKIYSKSKSSGVALEIAVLARSEQPTAPRMPKPRSVKLMPFRQVRPMPSVFIHLIREVSTPPCIIKSSISIPTSLSAKAVMTAVFKRKHLRSPRITLYSPPPSQARKLLAVRILPSPGSKRSITSPRDTASYLHSSAGFNLKSMVIFLPFSYFRISAASFTASAVRRSISPNFPSATRSPFTIQLPPQAATALQPK